MSSSKIKLFYILLLTVVIPFENKINFESGSSISYLGYHVLHSWIGTSSNFDSRIICNDDSLNECTLEIAVPLSTFDSGNSTRDSNMLLMMKSGQYPLVFFKSEKFDISISLKDDFIIKGELSFNGFKKQIMTKVYLRNEGNFMKGNSTFRINLTDFEVERPQLLFIPMSEEVEINVELIFKDTLE